MIRKRLELTLAELIEEAEELTRRLRDLQERHLPDLDVVTEDNRPIRFPLEVNWRLYEHVTVPSEVATEVSGWIHNHLDVHIGVKGGAKLDQFGGGIEDQVGCEAAA